MTPSKKLILIVEDFEAESYSLARLVRHAGYRAFECRTIASARGLLDTKPDAIIIDLNLPDGSGLDFSSELKQTQVTSHIPVVLISSNPNLANEQSRLLQSKADMYLNKPIDHNELIKALKELVCCEATD